MKQIFFGTGIKAYISTYLLIVILGIIILPNFFGGYAAVGAILAMWVVPFFPAVWVEYKKHEHSTIYLIIKWLIIHIIIQFIITYGLILYRENYLNVKYPYYFR